MRPTTKRLARIAGLGVATLVAAGALLWLLLSDSHGPLINGKPVAYWTRQLSLVQMDQRAINALAGEKAVAIPALVKQLSLPDLAVKDFAKRLWRGLPSALQDLVPEPTTRAELRAGAAFGLVSICEDAIHPTRLSLSEAQMILPALTNALRDRDVTVRDFATDALGKLEVISSQAIEACEVPLKDPYWMVRCAAVHSLGRLGRSDERAIPCLKSALSDSRPLVREHAATFLELLGPPLRNDASSATESK